MEKKKIIVVGSTGTIGQKVLELLGDQYQLITINRTSGDYQVDMQDAKAVEETFKAIGTFDGLIATSPLGYASAPVDA